MNTPTTNHRFTPLSRTLFAIVLAAALPSYAQRYWDTSDTTGIQGGNGNWNTTLGTSNWNTAADGTASRVDWTNGNAAVFDSAGSYTVTASGTLEASNITIKQGTVNFSGTVRLLTSGSLLVESGAGAITFASLAQGNNTVFENQSESLLTISTLNRISGTTSFTFTGTGNTTVGSLQNTNGGNVTKSGDGLLRINAFSNTSATKFRVDGGTMWINTSTVSGGNTPTTSTAADALRFNGGTLRTSHNRIFGLGSIAAHGITLQAGGGTMEQDVNTTFTQAGVITGEGALTKTGLGTLHLSGTETHTYAGATNVTQGTLRVDASLDNTGGLVSVNNGGTLAGTGTISRSIVVNSGGTLSPGNSPGTLNTAGQTWNNGGNYNWQILDATGLAGTGYDTIAITGSLDLTNLTGATDFNINLWSLSSIGPDVNGDASNFNMNSNYTWTLVSTTGGISGFNAEHFTINKNTFNNTSGFSNPLAPLGKFSLAVVDGNKLNLNYIAIPEPGTLVLMGLSLGALALFRRRKRG